MLGCQNYGHKAGSLQQTLEFFLNSLYELNLSDGVLYNFKNIYKIDYRNCDHSSQYRK